MFKRLRGIFYGWWMVAASFFMMLISSGTAVYGFTAFFDPIYQEMNWTRAETALAFSLRSVEGGIVQPIIGFFVDRIGSRKCILAGMIIMSVSLVLISRLSNLATFYTGFVILAFGNTLSSGIPQQSAIANWFRKRRGLALGILMAGAGLSGTMTPVFTKMIDTIGWRETLLITSPFVFLVGVPLALVIRRRPERYGLRPDGEKVAVTDETTKVKNDASKNVPVPVPVDEGMDIKQCLRSPIFWLLLLYSCLTSFANSALMVHAMSHLVNVGISRDMAALTMTGYTSFSLVGRIGLSWLGDKYSKKNILLFCAAMQAIGILIFSYISGSSPWMIIAFIIFYAPGFGGPIPLLPAIQADYFGTKAFATMRGLMAIGYTVPGIIGPWFAGWVADTTGGYQLAFLIYSALTVCAIPVMMVTTLKRAPVSEAEVEVAGVH